MGKINKLLYVDLFCGAGGTSTGVESAMLRGEKCAKVVACVNHDANAIASHYANHKESVHFTEDIRTLNIQPLKDILDDERKKHPGSKTVLWASLECTNFSKAKGGKEKNADSRTLAEHLFRYIEILNTDFIQIENVEEFMSWGDLNDKGHPISRDRGRCFLKWIKKVEEYGYYFDYKILNSADFGAYTSRKRFFGQFAKKGLYHAWPSATHCKTGNDGYEIFGYEVFKKWKPVKDVLDIEDEGESIFNRKKPLCENTLKRIYAGMVKFVAGGKEAFLVRYNSMTNPKQKLVSVKQYLMNPQFNSPGGSINNPCFTLIARMDKRPPYLITAQEGVGIEIYENDSPMTVAIKEFMAMYGIVDICMRMLKVEELKQIMGFPKDYILIGTKSEQKKFIGNAVEVNMAKALCEALSQSINIK